MNMVDRRQLLLGGFGIVAAAALVRRGWAGGSPATAAASDSTTPMDVAESVADEGTRSFDGAWGPVTIPTNPQRIVTVGTAITATMLAMDLAPLGAALQNIAGIRYLDGRLDGITDVGAASLVDVNREAVLALEPDLVLAHGYDFQQDAATELNEIVPTVGVITGYTRLDETYAFWRAVGDACGHPDNSDALIADVQGRLDELAERIGTRMTDKPISLLRVSADGIGVRTGALESSIPLALGIPRPENQRYNTSTGFDISFENLAEVDAWAIFVFVDNDAADAQAELERNPLWKTLSAVTANRAFFVDASAWNAFDPFAANVILDDLDTHLSTALSAG